MFPTHEKIFAIERMASSSVACSKYLNELLLSLINAVFSDLEESDLPNPVLLFDNALSSFSSDQMKQSYAEGFAQGFVASKIQKDEDDEHGTWMYFSQKNNLHKPFSVINQPKEQNANPQTPPNA